MNLEVGPTPLLHTKGLQALRAGMCVKVIKTFVSDDDHSDELKAGISGCVWEIDKDGDARIKFQDIAKCRRVLKKNFCRLEVQALPSYIQVAKQGRTVPPKNEKYKK